MRINDHGMGQGPSPTLFSIVFLVSLAIGFVACPLTDCNEDAITSATPPPPNCEDDPKLWECPQPDPDPPFNSGPYWAPGEWGDGVTGFGLCARSPEEQKRFHRSYLSRGYEFTRILSETGEWGHYWEENGARGPSVGAGAIESFE